MPPKLLHSILDRVVVAELPIMCFVVVLEKWYCCLAMAFVLAVRYLSASTSEAPTMEVDHTQQVESSCYCTLPVAALSAAQLAEEAVVVKALRTDCQEVEPRCLVAAGAML